MEITSHVNSICNSMSYRIGNCLIDPGDEWEGFHDLSTVLLTHGHFDHIYGLNRVIELNQDVRIYTNDDGREMLCNAKKNLSLYNETPFVISDNFHIIIIDHDAEIDLGIGLKAKAIFTTGHNPSCITWVIGDAVFTGDSFISRIKTVTNLPGGNKKEAEQSIKLIKDISIGKKIYPGHKI